MVGLGLLGPIVRVMVVWMVPGSQSRGWPGSGSGVGGRGVGLVSGGPLRRCQTTLPAGLSPGLPTGLGPLAACGRDNLSVDGGIKELRGSAQDCVQVGDIGPNWVIVVSSSWIFKPWAATNAAKLVVRSIWVRLVWSEAPTRVTTSA